MPVSHFENPHPELPIARLGSAIAQSLEEQQSRAAREFLGLFSYVSSTGTQSLVGVGAEYTLRAARDGDSIHLTLDHRGRIEREERFALGKRDLHEEVFRRTGEFVEALRPWLVSERKVPPSSPLFGGWRCATHPDRIEDVLVFTIPRLTCRVSAEEVRLHSFGEESGAELARLVAAPGARLPEPGPSGLPSAPRREIPECRDYVDDLVQLIGNLSQEAMDKVVICREVRVQLDSAVSPIALLSAAAARTKARYEYVFRWEGGDSWIGVSPEMLFKKEGSRIVVEPLAGTRKGSSSKKGGRYREELLNDGKEVEEHETAARMFHDKLESVCVANSIEQLESRGVIDLGYVQHLKSTIAGVLKPELNVFDLLAAIYPPATIWGKPIALSGERIRNHERIQRDFFAGGLGFFTLEDDADIALAIRTARLAGREVSVYAGSGIVRRSDPYREWLETGNKMQPFLGT